MIDKFKIGIENARYLKKLLLKSHLDRITTKNPNDCHMWEGRTLINMSAIINLKNVFLIDETDILNLKSIKKKEIIELFDNLH